MAQWIPKTAWRVSNLNKRYGPSYITSGDVPLSTFGRAPIVYDATMLKKKLSCAEGLVMIDVRDALEQQRYPVPCAVALHHHDLLSGAACPILPREKESSELFIIASNLQRGVNSSTALQRWGYSNVFLVDYESLVEAGCIGDAEDDEKMKTVATTP
ncbi:hypothetical protein C3747_284g20 [Trypanosoma cruzi]|uniref:Rhodanese domain-containing protein n=2 Tax=Trypanosoma cruzi TaxID=5693 RepID=Q4DUD2_TRYCC|nr:hypothetical protein, conserved [Trypanosoma cruzi]EAN96123.1 hypothetical protein, conserved [Trypanosoma cruzi]PWU93948.1 hypothetical protein C3747_284g20 [Trypanosoma cruzi]RNC54191.1 hypothetical protein TcCL_ESM08405 [Trypanosoma cruzi]|eukprot:XP_817974.1 hypothetical protein [Trypanosoma cruzi strain CL Brener]